MGEAKIRTPPLENLSTNLDAVLNISTVRPQGVDMQNLTWINSAVSAVRMCEKRVSMLLTRWYNKITVNVLKLLDNNNRIENILRIRDKRLYDNIFYATSRPIR